MKTNIYAKSQGLLKDYFEFVNFRSKVCLWQLEKKNSFLIECWMLEGKVHLFQLWKDNGGFCEYVLK